MSGCKERQKLADKYTSEVSEWSKLVSSLQDLDISSKKYSAVLKRIDEAKSCAQEAMEAFKEHVKDHKCA